MSPASLKRRCHLDRKRLTCYYQGNEWKTLCTNPRQSGPTLIGGDSTFLVNLSASTTTQII